MWMRYWKYKNNKTEGPYFGTKVSPWYLNSGVHKNWTEHSQFSNPKVFFKASFISIFKIKTNFDVVSSWDRVSYSVRFLWTPEFGYHGLTLDISYWVDLVTMKWANCRNALSIYLWNLFIITNSASELTIFSNPITVALVLVQLLLAFGSRPNVLALLLTGSAITQFASQLAMFGNPILVAFTFILSFLAFLGWPNIFANLSGSSFSCGGGWSRSCGWRGCCSRRWSRCCGCCWWSDQIQGH